MKRFMLVVIVITALVGWWRPESSEAKGPPSRIIISSPGLESDIVVEDDGLMALLSLTGLENVRLEVVEVPPDIDIGYELQRQYKSGQDFRTFDRTVYYPSTVEGRVGYVHYLGIVDGSSSYDGKWFQAHPDAELAMQYILSTQHLRDFVIAYQADGQILLLDPTTLETQYTLDIGQRDVLYVNADGASLDGTQLFIGGSSGDRFENLVIDLQTLEVCSTGVHQFVMPTLDMQHLLFQVGDVIEVRDQSNFEIVRTLDLDKEGVVYTFPTPDHTRTFVVGWDQDSDQHRLLHINALSAETLYDHEIDFPTHQNFSGTWDTTYGQFYLTDGDKWHAWEAWNEQINPFDPIYPHEELSAMREAGVTIDVIGTHHGLIYFYPRLGRYWLWDTNQADRFEGGIFVARPHTTEDKQSRIHPDIDFQHVIMQGNVLYGLEAPIDAKSATLYKMDIDGGKMLLNTELPIEVHRLGYARLDTRQLDGFALKTNVAAAREDLQKLEQSVQQHDATGLNITLESCTQQLPFDPVSTTSKRPATATPQKQ